MLKALKRSSRGLVMVRPDHQLRGRSAQRGIFLTFCASEFVSYSAKDRKETRCKAVMMQHARRYFIDTLDSRKIRPHHFHRQARFAAHDARSRDR
jgi:hypothetical protein